MTKRESGFVDEVCLVIIIFAAIIAATIVGALWLDAAQCNNRARMMRLESDYGPLQGCMVRVQERWSPIEYIRIVNGNVSIQGDGE